MPEQTQPIVEGTWRSQYTGYLKYVAAIVLFGASALAADYIGKRHPEVFKDANSVLEQILNFGNNKF